MTPAVDPRDVRSVWELMRMSGATDRAIDSATEPAGAVGFDRSVLAGTCSAGADVMAVWLRAALLQALEHGGLLTRWQNGGQLDNVVFEVAATFPLGVNSLDAEAFLERLRSAS